MFICAFQFAKNDKIEPTNNIGYVINAVDNYVKAQKWSKDFGSNVVLASKSVTSVFWAGCT